MVNDLYLSFNKLYTKEECIKSLQYSNGDLEAAANWLISQAEKIRKHLTLNSTETTILFQSEMTSTIPLSNIKLEIDIKLKAGSLINIDNVIKHIWTMGSNGQVSLYTN